MAELTIQAATEALDEVLDFVNGQLERYECPMKVQMQVDIAVEEIYVNIAHYAYHPGVGPATIRVEVIEKPLQVVVGFVDNGVPYNPLEKQDPDVTLDVDQRDIGGLGIFMVKKSMDALEYEYREGKNILTISKKFHQ